MSPEQLAGECGTLAVEAVAQLRAKGIRASSELGFNGSHAYVVIPTKSETGEVGELVLDPSIRQVGGADNLLGGKAFFLGSREQLALIMSEVAARHYLP